MAAKLHKGDQFTTTYVNASGEKLPGDVVNVATGYDVVIVNIANDTVGQNTAVAQPSASAVYTVDKDDDFAVTAGDHLVYNTSDEEFSGVATAGLASWVAVEDAVEGATSVKAMHVLSTVDSDT